MRIEPDGTRTQETYWEPVFERSAERADWSETDWQEAILASLRTAVERRLVADVPVGCLLSGGLDSSLIVGLLAEAGQHGLQTFSIGFEAAGGEEGDEFKYSDVIARHYGTDHHQIRIDTARMLPALSDTIGAMSEPMVSHDCVAFYLLSQEVSKHVKVVQSGQGADEIFAGYHWYPPMAHAADDDLDDALARYRQAFFDRDHDGLNRLLQPRVAARRRRRRGVRARALRASRRGDRDRSGAAAGHHGDARRRSGEARRQHDDGVGAGGSRAVPRPRARRARRHLPARAEDRVRRQGRAEGGRPQGHPARGDRPAEGLLPGARAQAPRRGRTSTWSRDALHSSAARDRGLFAPDAVDAHARRPQRQPHAAARKSVVADRLTGTVAGPPRGRSRSDHDRPRPATNRTRSASSRTSAGDGWSSGRRARTPSSSAPRCARRPADAATSGCTSTRRTSSSRCIRRSSSSTRASPTGST